MTVRAHFIGGSLDGTDSELPEGVPVWYHAKLRPLATAIFATKPDPSARPYEEEVYRRAPMSGGMRDPMATLVRYPRVVYILDSWYDKIRQYEESGPRCASCGLNSEDRRKRSEALKKDYDEGSYDCLADGTGVPPEAAFAFRRTVIYRSQIQGMGMCKECGAWLSVERTRHRITPYSPEEVAQHKRAREESDREWQRKYPHCEKHAASPEVCWKLHL